MQPKLFEVLGVRAVYRAVSFATNDRLLPVSSASDGLPSKQTLDETKQGTVYFFWANFVRIALDLPALLVFSYKKQMVAAIYVGLIVCMHATMMVIELYKRSLCDWHYVGAPAETEQTDLVSNPRFDSYFRPRKVESPRFYKWTGIDAFQKFVEWVVRVLTHGPKTEEREFLKGLSRVQVLQFEKTTRTSEIVHLFMTVIMTPMAVFAWQIGPPVLAVACTMYAIGDFGLVMLQRKHRSRVWALVQRARRRTA